MRVNSQYMVCEIEGCPTLSIAHFIQSMTKTNDRVSGSWGKANRWTKLLL